METSGVARFRKSKALTSSGIKRKVSSTSDVRDREGDKELRLKNPPLDEVILPVGMLSGSALALLKGHLSIMPIR
jgi:hypothetical protein